MITKGSVSDPQLNFQASKGSVPQDLPPPYTGVARIASEAGSTSAAQLSPSLPRRVSIFQPSTQQVVRRYFLHTKDNAISGTFIVDPVVPEGSSVGDCDEHSRRIRTPLDSDNKRFFGNKHTPNASFRTRTGPISLNLSLASDGEGVLRGYIQVSNRRGPIKVDLSSPQPKMLTCLEVSTRVGPMVVCIPQTFQGLIQIRSRKGLVEFLPAFSQRAHVVHGSDRDSLILFGRSEKSLTDVKSELLDLCLLSTRSGKITIGVSGIDRYEEDKAGGSGWFRGLWSRDGE